MLMWKKILCMFSPEGRIHRSLCKTNKKRCQGSFSVNHTATKKKPSCPHILNRIRAHNMAVTVNHRFMPNQLNLFGFPQNISHSTFDNQNRYNA